MGIKANPTRSVDVFIEGPCELIICSFLLNYALAEQYEIQGKTEEANECYDAFLRALQEELEEIRIRLPPPTAELAAGDKPSASQSSDKSRLMENGKPNERNPETQLRELCARRVREMGSAWCMYMRFARRSQSQMAARKVFALAREAKQLDWRVYDFAGASLLSHRRRDIRDDEVRQRRRSIISRRIRRWRRKYTSRD